MSTFASCHLLRTVIRVVLLSAPRDDRITPLARHSERWSLWRICLQSIKCIPISLTTRTISPCHSQSTRMWSSKKWELFRTKKPLIRPYGGFLALKTMNQLRLRVLSRSQAVMIRDSWDQKTSFVTSKISLQLTDSLRSNDFDRARSKLGM